MSFLDRFKIQPKYKSADPDVRAAAVQELGTGDEDAALLAAIAREDADARVRRVALARVQDMGVLTSAAASDPDPEVRLELLLRLAGIAVSDNAVRAAQAVPALADQRQLADVASTSPHD